jgi:hypothetical protein
LATSISAMSGGRGSEPAWVVRMRFSLCCMTDSGRKGLLICARRCGPALGWP